MRITGARVFDPALGFVERPLCIREGRIAGPEDEGEGPSYSTEGCALIPGLIDLHFHGCVGADISDGDQAGLRAIAEYQLKRGVTRICPAGMTLPEAQLVDMCRAAAAYRRADPPGAKLCGLHLEGPFLSEAKKGAQRGEWLHLPDLELVRRLAAESEGLCKLVSLAPELPGSLEFIAGAKDLLRVSIAHTTADYDTAMAAFRAGASHVTHLFNAMPPFSHRAPGVVGAAADAADCMVEIIADGVHLHPAMVRAVFKLFGPERVILVSDSIRATGLPSGEYTLGGQAVRVEGKRSTLADGTLAGSVTDLMGCLVSAVAMGIPLEQAVTAASYNPAKALGLSGEAGSLEEGREADLVVLGPDLKIRAVVQGGRIVEGSLTYA